MDSILNTIKKNLGVGISDTSFDTDIVMHINSTISLLSHQGIGPKDGFLITDDTDTWDDYYYGRADLAGMQTLLYLKVKLLFDPPSTSYILESMQRQIAEYEWRLGSQTELTS